MTSDDNGAAARAPLWLDPQLAAVERAEALVSALTVAQKVQLALSNVSSPLLAGLGIPVQLASDGPAGVRGATGVTAFPAPIALAACFDPGLAHEYGAAIAAEVRGKGRTTWLGPCVDLVRTPLAGRQAEALGEDPLLAAQLGASQVIGARSMHVISMLKHYTGYHQERGRVGYAVGPTLRDRDDAVNVIVSEKALRELYFPAFAAAVQAGASAVMGSYNRLNGEYVCQSAPLLGALKDDLGFAGPVAPDFGFAVRDQIAATNAGLDRPTLDDNAPGELTEQSLTSGEISAERLDDICQRTLHAVFDSGLFDNPVPDATSSVSSDAHRDLARRVAIAGTVLLKNDGVLPLGAGPASIAVIGPAGEDAFYVVGGSAAVTVEPGQVVTPLQAIRARAGSLVSVHAAQGSRGDAPLSPIPAEVLGAASSGGLMVAYWNNGEFSGDPILIDSASTIDLEEPPGGFQDVWSARWTGELTPPESGTYQLSILAAGRVALYLDGEEVLAGEREAVRFIEGPYLPMSAEVDLAAGRAVAIRLDYSTCAAVFPPQVTLGWQVPSASLIDTAAQAAASAEVAVVLVNNAQSEGMDRATLAVPGDQDRLVRAVAAANPNTVVVVNSGGPILMPWIDEVAAVLHVWYPGEQFGSALAAVLFGDADPAGRLPVTFPASDEQGPAPRSRPERYPGVGGTVRYDEGVFVGYRWYDANDQEPLFPFGFGLSYSTIRYDDPRLEVDTDGSLRVLVKAANAGRDGSDLLQLYVEFPPEDGRRQRQLKAFQKVSLAAGATTDVTLGVAADGLASYRPGVGWEIAPGTYTVWLGASSRDLRPCGRVISQPGTPIRADQDGR